MGCAQSRTSVVPTQLAEVPPTADVKITSKVVKVPPRADVKISAKAQKGWTLSRGRAIEPLLASGAVALLDASWLLELAEKPDATISRRQGLPPEAFVTVHQLKAAGRADFSLRIILCSYPWMHPEHPDPKGVTLSILARVLRAYLAKDGKVYGVFWDFGSLHQHPRTAAEDVLFKQGLGGLASLFAHEFITVIRFSKLPDEYPEAYDLPEGANGASYQERGWCFTESNWAGMTKAFHLNLDLGALPPLGAKGHKDLSKWQMINACNRSRKPPLLPSQFSKAAQTKSFTNGKDDRPRVVKL